MLKKIFSGNLKSTGLRQVAKTIDKIEARHKMRYYFAAFFLDCAPRYYGKTIRITDIGCGIGYGDNILANLLGEKLESIDAFDADGEAISFAKKHYGHNKIRFHEQNCLPSEISKAKVLDNSDVIISFEFLEHIDLADSESLLAQLLLKSNMLIFSFPIDNLSKFHKIIFSAKQIDEYVKKGIAACPVKKYISHSSVQDGRYAVFVIESV